MLILFALEMLLPPRAIAVESSVCPETLETLVEQMLPDLPGYANRVLRRSPPWNQQEVKIYLITAGNPEFEPLPLGPGRSLSTPDSNQGSSTLPSFPGSNQGSNTLPSFPGSNQGSNQGSNTLPSFNSEGETSQGQTDDSEIPQVFITTLERQYRGTQLVEIPRYHWLFLTPTPEGWRLALIFSRIGSNRPNEPLAPPEESSQSFIAEAIRLWLRDVWLKDCRDRKDA